MVAQGSESDFIFVRQGRRGEPEIITSDSSTPFSGTSPALAIDLCEHAYFGDYLFNKDAYLKNAINLLDINKIFSGANSEIYLDTIV